ncbi:unnamed protein product [Acanthoscelides obtectus]|uniref:Uncharacterized protein n=1 Tax=Acanthoscelides obtectus TaxID=200917 RepID=A0A9P0K501_ACAOB|nr:unnamed protein product [Acanthoscelides obtectus]CAK1646708.1 hypothetical protein AOBTE_LOCUS14831 [Acanthoscelides obtectus]
MWLKRDEGRGKLNMLREEILLDDPNIYKNFLRIYNECFNELLRMNLPDIAKQDTHLRECITAENRSPVVLKNTPNNLLFNLSFSTNLMSDHKRGDNTPSCGHPLAALNLSVSPEDVDMILHVNMLLIQPQIR